MSEQPGGIPYEPDSFTNMIISDKNGNNLINMGKHHIVGPYVAEIHVHPQLEISCVQLGECCLSCGRAVV